MSAQAKSWPESVGQNADQVASQISAEGFQTEIKPEGAPCTRDFRPDRVRIFVDANNVVVAAPHTG